MAAINHQNNFATNLTSNQIAGVTTTPLNSIPSIAAPFYIALDATNINSKYEVVYVTSKTATHINHAATTYAHTTAEEVRLDIPAAEADDIQTSMFTGWTKVYDTWTYASANTITVPAGAASLYKKGDKLKLTQTTDKYFYVTGVADTVLTVTAGSDFTVANAAITAPHVSRQASPVGFPDEFNWAGAASGFSALTVATYTFSLNGTVCTINVEVAGTSNNATHAMTLPIAFNSAHAEIRFPIYVVDNGTAATGRAEFQSGATSLPLAATLAGGAFTASGACQSHITASYIIN